MERHLIAWLVFAAFSAISLLHLAWVLRCLPAGDWAVPSVPSGPRSEYVPAFRPGRAATLAVAAALAVVAGLVAWRAGLFAQPQLHPALGMVLLALAVLMWARAVGDFRLVGFFKPANVTTFARLDTWLYSPLCLLLGSGLAHVAIR